MHRLGGISRDFVIFNPRDAGMSSYTSNVGNISYYA